MSGKTGMSWGLSSGIFSENMNIYICIIFKSCSIVIYIYRKLYECKTTQAGISNLNNFVFKA